MHRMRWPVVVLFGVAACSDPAPPGQGLDVAMVQQVLARVDRLVEVLDAQSRAGVSVSMGGVVAASAVDAAAEATERAAVSPDPGVVGRLEALERAVAVLAGSRSLPTLTVPPSGAPPMRETVVAAMCDQKGTEAARCSVFGQTPQAIMDRFGVPRSVGLLGSHQKWSYSAPGVNRHFSLLFVDGVVVSID